MRVLIACEFSGTVRDAFIARGHDAVSCDLLPTESEGPHIVGDALDAAYMGGPWDLMIAHPPCTYLTISAEWCYKDVQTKRKSAGVLYGAERRAARVKATEFFRALLNAPIPRIAIENPVGCISTAIRKPDQTIQPYQFGHDASKRTCLWLKGLRPLMPTLHVEPRMVNGKSRWGNQTDSGQNRLGPSADRWALRSLTYPGIANAMAGQWGQS